MTSPLRVLRVLGDRPFAEVGRPVLAVADEKRGLVAVAGEPGEGGMSTVAVYDAGDFGCRAVHRTPFAVHALAFHPTAPLLAVGTGGYDGGYFFEGELLLFDWETAVATSLVESDLGRQVLGLVWQDERELRVLMAPPDDWEDDRAFDEGYVAVVRRTDWRTVPARSLTGTDLAGPRVPAPRPDGSGEAHRTLAALSPGWRPRRQVLAVEEPTDGPVTATFVRREGDPEQPGLTGQADGLIVRERTVSPRSEWYLRLRIRGRSRAYVYQVRRRGPGRRAPKQYWISARSPKGARARPLFPFDWESGHLRFPGPGAEVGGGDLVHAGQDTGSHRVRAGESFVVRRAASDGAPRWVFRTDHLATGLDVDPDGGTAYVGYRNGDIVALDLRDGAVVWRHALSVAGISAVPTALTVARSGGLLVGTADGRVLDCAAGRAPGSRAR